MGKNSKKKLKRKFKKIGKKFRKKIFKKIRKFFFRKNEKKWGGNSKKNLKKNGIRLQVSLSLIVEEDKHKDLEKISKGG